MLFNPGESSHQRFSTSSWSSDFPLLWKAPHPLYCDSAAACLYFRQYTLIEVSLMSLSALILTIQQKASDHHTSSSAHAPTQIVLVGVFFVEYGLHHRSSCQITSWDEGFCSDITAQSGQISVMCSCGFLRTTRSWPMSLWSVSRWLFGILKIDPWAIRNTYVISFWLDPIWSIPPVLLHKCALNGCLTVVNDLIWSWESLSII